jgi:hypothetical protein
MADHDNANHYKSIKDQGAKQTMFDPNGYAETQ